MEKNQVSVKASVKNVAVLLCLAIVAALLLGVCSQVFKISDDERNARALKIIYNGSETPKVQEIDGAFATSNYGSVNNVWKVGDDMYIVKSTGYKASGWASASQVLSRINKGMLEKVVAVSFGTDDRTTGVTQEYLDSIYANKDANTTVFSSKVANRDEMVGNSPVSSGATTSQYTKHSVAGAVNAAIDYLKGIGALRNEAKEIATKLNEMVAGDYTKATTGYYANGDAEKLMIRHYFTSSVANDAAIAINKNDKIVIAVTGLENNVRVLRKISFFDYVSADGATFAATLEGKNLKELKAIAAQTGDLDTILASAIFAVDLTSRDANYPIILKFKSVLDVEYKSIDNKVNGDFVKVATATTADGKDFYAVHVTVKPNECGAYTDDTFEFVVFVETATNKVIEARCVANSTFEIPFHITQANMDAFKGIAITSKTVFDTPPAGGLITGATATNGAIKLAFSRVATYYVDKDATVGG